MAAGRFECIALRADASTRRSTDGRTVLGGAPLRLLRFSERGAAAVDRVLSGSPVSSRPDDQAVAARLVDAGMAHPVPGPPPALRVAIVVPVRDDDGPLRALLVSDDFPTGVDVVVVDDASTEPAAVDAAVDGRGRVLHRRSSCGPGGARNTGWAATDADVVVFLDADARPVGDWLPGLLAHFADPAVGVVAPRIRTTTTSLSARDRYETVRSPLDLGPTPARVAPGGRVTYVPTATLACRRAVLDDLRGFDEGLRVGEDVDFVWRAIGAGWTVRYEPTVIVTHPPRPSWSRWLRQRVAYGSAAAGLDRRHPGQVAPVRLNAWSLAAWTFAASGPVGVALGAATTVGSAAALVPKLRGRIERPARVALELAGGGTLSVGSWLARAVWRAWLPLAVPAAVVSTRARRILAISAIVPAVQDWVDAETDLDVVRFTVLHATDDAAYCAGVWLGAWRLRSWRCLAPRLTGIPGVTDPG